MVWHLSEAQVELAKEVFDEYRDKEPMELSQLTHDFPEWQDPGESCLPISYELLLSKLKKDAEEIQAFEKEIEGHNLLEEMLAP